jgi:SAM-dependent methyltransferase
MKEYWEQRLSDRFDLRGVGYIGMAEAYNKWLYRLRRLVFIRRITPLLSDLSAAKVLDVGSGTGFYIELWRMLGARKIVGIDLTEISVKRLRNKYPDCDFYQINIGAELTPLANHKFDVISAFDVLYHIIDDETYDKAIHNLFSLLKPGGVLLLSENFLHGKTERAARQVSRSLEYIQNQLFRVGLKPLGRFPQFFIMNAPVDTNSSLLKNFWRVLRYLAGRSEIVGWLTGFCLFPIEALLVFIKKESISSEIMICQRPLEI